MANSAGSATAETQTVAPGHGALTREHAIVGTAGYMSPEQVRGRQLDGRTDLFSFGAVLYEMATGKMPFEGANSVELCASILRDEPRIASELNPAVSSELRAVIHKALEKDRSMRYQSASEIIRVGEGVPEIFGLTPSPQNSPEVAKRLSIILRSSPSGRPVRALVARNASKSLGLLPAWPRHCVYALLNGRNRSDCTSVRKEVVHWEAFLDAVAHGSALSWQYINLLGEYDFSDKDLQDSVGIRLPKLVN